VTATIRGRESLPLENRKGHEVSKLITVATALKISVAANEGDAVEAVGISVPGSKTVVRKELSGPPTFRVGMTIPFCGKYPQLRVIYLLSLRVTGHATSRGRYGRVQRTGAWMPSTSLSEPASEPE